MEFVEKPPQWLLDLLPEGARDLLDGWGWWVVLGFLGLIVVLIVWAVWSKVWGRLFGWRARHGSLDELQERLEDLPPPPALTGDRRLTVEGVPVRVRLVVIAAAGTDVVVTEPMAPQLLNQLVAGLGEIVLQDQPRTRVWPPQLSYEGFANTFHRSTPLPEGEGNLSRWVLVAGRGRIGKQQVLVGLGLLALQPTTVGRLRLDAHQWNTFLRVKVRE
jgi:hypothetical protein